MFADSNGGHTWKIAAAIAEELGVSVGEIRRLLPEAEILFPGSGVYGNGPGTP